MSALPMIWNFDDLEELAIVNRMLHEDVLNWPQHVCHEISYLIATEYVAPNAGGMGAPNAEGLNTLVTSLQRCTAASENIAHTPIYTPYTVFTGRVLYSWVHVLPFVFIGVAGPVATPVLSIAAAFLFLGIDDIGQRVEQPFALLPLWQYCDVVDQDCLQLLKTSKAFA